MTDATSKKFSRLVEGYQGYQPKNKITRYLLKVLETSEEEALAAYPLDENEQAQLAYIRQLARNKDLQAARFSSSMDSL